MYILSRTLLLTVASLALALGLSACGGGNAEPPPNDAAPAGPTVTITDSEPGPTATGDVTFTFAFSANVGTSFTASDVEVTGGTKGAFAMASDGRSATLVVVPPPNSTGTMTVAVAAGAFEDSSGTKNTVNAFRSQDFSTVPAGSKTQMSLPVSFDSASVDYGLIGFGGAEDSAVAADPTNAANMVAKVVRAAGAESFAGTTITAAAGLGFSPKVPFNTTDTKISVRVWSPDAGIPVRMKVEDHTDKDKSVETETTTTVAGAWQTLTFDFKNQVAGTAALNLSYNYDKATIFFDFGRPKASAVQKSYYFDDVTFVPGTGGGGGTGTTLASFDETPPLPFAGFGGAEGSSIDPAPPAGGGSGKAAKIVRSGGFVYAGAAVTVAPVPFAANRKTITARVYSPKAGIPIKLKAEYASGSGTADASATTAVVVGWQTLTWVLGDVDLTKSYTAVVMLPDIGTLSPLAGDTYYFDDIKLSDAVVTPPPTGTDTVLVTFDETPPPLFTGFGGAEGSTIDAAPPAGGGTGKAAKIVRSGGFVYAGAAVTVAPVPFAADRKTITARVYSPKAGIPIKLKAEYASGSGTADASATTAVVVGWQTLTWVLGDVDLTKSYTAVVMLPDIGTLSPAAGDIYYFDDITLAAAVVTPPPTGTSTVLVSFDETPPPAFVGFGGAEGSSIDPAPPAGGGSGKAAKIIRSGGFVYAGASVTVAPIPFAADRKTITARVYSPKAGIPIKLKVEYASGSGTADASATTAVVVGWQTLTWVLGDVDLTKSYTSVVMLPDIGTLSPVAGDIYYFDDITLAAGGASGGGGNGEMGSGGAQTLTLAAGNIKTPNGGVTFFVAGEAIFAADFEGSAEALPPFNKAAWPGAHTLAYPGVGNNAGGSIGYFQDDVTLSNSAQKIDEGGWVSGSALDPNGVPNFFRYFVLKGPAFTNSYMGLYANAPNDGFVDIHTFSKIMFRLWGPQKMYESTYHPAGLEVILAGPKVAGCSATGSGGTEIAQTFTASQTIGAASVYKLPLAGFTVKGVCGSDTNGTAVAAVLSHLARVVVVVPGTAFNWTLPELGTDPPLYSIGLNLGTIGFTNN